MTSRSGCGLASRAGSTLLVLATALASFTNAHSDAADGASPPPAPRFTPPAAAIFVDDFTNGDLEHWTADQASVWSVRNGMLRAALPDGKQLHSFLYVGGASWADYAVEFDVCGIHGVDKGCAVRVQPGKKGLGIDLRGPDYDDLKLYVNQFPVGSAAVSNPNGTWHHVLIEIRGRDRCTVAIDGHVVLDNRLHPPAPARGGIALSAYTGGVGNCTVYYDNVAVTPLTSNTAMSR